MTQSGEESTVANRAQQESRTSTGDNNGIEYDPGRDNDHFDTGFIVGQDLNSDGIDIAPFWSDAVDQFISLSDEPYPITPVDNWFFPGYSILDLVSAFQ